MNTHIKERNSKWQNKVIYQIYPQSFYDANGDGIGDIQGIIQKLPYLNLLGIDIIWLSPIFKSPMDDNGYDISDYYTVADCYGTNEDLYELIRKAKDFNIGIMLDLVVNHTSDEHPWFIESKSSTSNPKRDWYIWKKGKGGNNPPNNWGSYFTKSAWKKDELTDEYYLHLFSEKQPDLNWDNQNVRNAVYDIMIFWLDKGIAGFRMDVINLISKPEGFEDSIIESQVQGSELWANGPKVHQYLQEMYNMVLSKYDVLTVGETVFVDVNDGILYAGMNRNELNMIFQFEHMAVDSNPNDTYDMLELDLIELKKVMTRWQEGLYDNGWNSLYWNNHDQPRVVSRFGNDSEYRVKSAKMLAATLHCMFGTPFIYQGEEIGMTNINFDKIEMYQDIWSKHYYNIMTESGIDESEVIRRLQKRSRDNARTPMQWTSEGGFTNGNPWIQINPNTEFINVETSLSDKNSIFHYYKKLIQLRKSKEYGDVIVYGAHQLILPESKDVYAYYRYLDDCKMLIISNFSISEQQVKMQDKVINTILSNYNDIELKNKNLLLRPYESVIFEVELQYTN